MLPFYLFGNLHCIGMCGPLVMMLGRNRFRTFYLIGRILSFSLVGLIAGGLGTVLHLFLKQYHMAVLASFMLGILMIGAGLANLIGFSLPTIHWLASFLAKGNRWLSTLMLKDKPGPIFLFGFFTVTLPCGQTLIVFSACALTGDLYVGLLNGFMFALLTSPSLYFAMHAHALLQKAKSYYSLLLGGSALLVGALAICRGLADLEIIPHLILNTHLVLY
jgi:uncharacterized protein